MADENQNDHGKQFNARVAEDELERKRKLAPLKADLRERHAERNWPLDSRTMQPAEIDPEDVSAPLDDWDRELTPDEIARRNAAANAEVGTAFEVDETLVIHRRAEFDREQAARAKVVGAKWTEELVEARIEEAFRVLNRMKSGPMGPRAFGNAMPEIVRSMADMVAQAGNKSLRKMVKRALRNHGPPTGPEVARAEDALGWAKKYLKDRDPDEALFFNLGGMWKAWDASISKKCKEIGVHRQVFYRDRKTAVRVIVAGLIKDGRAPT